MKKYSTGQSAIIKSFGTRLRYFRKERKLTQEQLAEAVNVSVEFISNVERGVNAPSFRTLEKLSYILKIPVKDFFDFEK